MAQMLIRKLDDDVKDALVRRARRNGRSIEEEARVILKSAVLEGEGDQGFGTRWAQAFADIGVDLEVPTIDFPMQIPDFESSERAE